MPSGMPMAKPPTGCPFPSISIIDFLGFEDKPGGHMNLSTLRFGSIDSHYFYWFCIDFTCLILLIPGAQGWRFIFFDKDLMMVHSIRLGAFK